MGTSLKIIILLVMGCVAAMFGYNVRIFFIGHRDPFVMTYAKAKNPIIGAERFASSTNTTMSDFAKRRLSGSSL